MSEGDNFTIEIEDDVPPPKDAGLTGQIRAKLREMKPGQSFWVPRGAKQSAHSLRNGVRTIAKRQNTPIQTSTEKKDGRDGLRVWKLSPQHKGR